MHANTIVGCAGWSISGAHKERFPEPGSHLERYARCLSGVEINSCFYRSHQGKTYARWANSVPPAFRFAVKLFKKMTHELGLANCDDHLAKYLDEVTELGEKLGVILIQLPPKRDYAPDVAETFLQQLRRRYCGPVVIEPRHATWFSDAAQCVLTTYHIGKVAADPVVKGDQFVVGADDRVAYFRLHGSPQMYYSNYEKPFLDDLSVKLAHQRRLSKQVWCIFDNTALGHAVSNALYIQSLVFQGDLSGADFDRVAGSDSKSDFVLRRDHSALPQRRQTPGGPINHV